MDITAIDKNFDLAFTVPEDVEWFSIEEHPFSVYGIEYSAEEGLYRRLPKEIADATSEAVSYLSRHSAGGRVRFSSNSPYIVVRVEEPFEKPSPHMTIAGERGVSVFANEQFVTTIMPSYDDLVNADERFGGNGKVVVY